MKEINCACGVTYTPADIYAKNRHEATAKHRNAVQALNQETFSDLEDAVVEEKPKRTRRTRVVEEIAEPVPVVEKPARATKKAAPPQPAKTNGTHKVCRVCGKDKPLEEYRKKSTRPDGRDTICASCAKDWDVAHAQKASA